MVREHQSFDPELIVQFLLKFTGLVKKTPHERIVLAVADELVDLAMRATAALEALPFALQQSEVGRAATAALRAALADGSVPATIRAGDDLERVQARFPAGELALLAERAELAQELAPLAAELRRFVGLYRALHDRVGWLLRGTSQEEVAALDPIADCDRIHTHLSSVFRIELRILETIVTNRIAQSASVSLFFRSTREAEDNAVYRFYDTFILLANFFEWGADSRRGREVVERLNKIHGRYYIPNAGMMYVLLQTAFTFIDGIERIAHRPLLDVERRGYFHAYVKLGRLMNIAEINDDYDAMYAWYQAFNHANRDHEPIKTDTFETIVGNSFGDVPLPGFREAIFLASRVAMDDTYRSAVGYATPTPEETAAVRAVFSTLGGLVERMPYTPHLRSLQNNPARSYYARPSQMGVDGRSRWMPGPDASRPNAGVPEDQRPIVNANDIAPLDLPVLEWSEIRRHDSAESLWVVISGEVYDLTHWAQRHPGGLKVLLAWAGKDATRAFQAAKHTPTTDVLRLNFRIGRAAGPEPERVRAPATDQLSAAE